MNYLKSVVLGGCIFAALYCVGLVGKFDGLEESIAYVKEHCTTDNIIEADGVKYKCEVLKDEKIN